MNHDASPLGCFWRGVIRKTSACLARKAGFGISAYRALRELPQLIWASSLGPGGRVCFTPVADSPLPTLCGRLSVGKGVLELLRSWSVRPCVRPFDAALRASGHNALIAAYRAPTNCAHSRCRVEAGSPGPAVSTGLLHQFNSPFPTYHSVTHHSVIE